MEGSHPLPPQPISLKGPPSPMGNQRGAITPSHSPANQHGGTPPSHPTANQHGGTTPPMANKSLASPHSSLLSTQSSTHPSTLLQHPPAPAQPLTGAPAGRCLGAAGPGRAHQWGSAAPHAAAQQWDRDVLQHRRGQSCKGQGHGWLSPGAPGFGTGIAELATSSWEASGGTSMALEAQWIPTGACGALKSFITGDLLFACEKGDAKPDEPPGTDGFVKAKEVEPRRSISIHPITRMPMDDPA